MCVQCILTVSLFCNFFCSPPLSLMCSSSQTALLLFSLPVPSHLSPPSLSPLSLCVPVSLIAYKSIGEKLCTGPLAAYQWLIHHQRKALSPCLVPIETQGRGCFMSPSPLPWATLAGVVCEITVAVGLGLLFRLHKVNKLFIWDFSGVFTCIYWLVDWLCVSVCEHVHVHVFACLCMHAWVWVCVRVCAYVCMYVCVLDLKCVCGCQSLTYGNEFSPHSLWVSGMKVKFSELVTRSFPWASSLTTLWFLNEES